MSCRRPAEPGAHAEDHRSANYNEMLCLQRTKQLTKPTSTLVSSNSNAFFAEETGTN